MCIILVCKIFPSTVMAFIIYNPLGKEETFICNCVVRINNCPSLVYTRILSNCTLLLMADLYITGSCHFQLCFSGHRDDAEDTYHCAENDFVV